MKALFSGLALSAVLLPAAQASSETDNSLSVLYPEPSYGVSLNPIGLLMLGLPGGIFSAEVTEFRPWQNLELGLPVVIGWYADDDTEWTNAELDQRFLAYVEPRVRYFFSGDSGWFVSAFSRVGYESWKQEGVESYRFVDDALIFENADGNAFRAGIGFGAGWRYHSDSGLYWSVEASMGRNFLNSYRGDEDLLYNQFEFIDNEEVFFDLRFMQLGYQF